MLERTTANREGAEPLGVQKLGADAHKAHTLCTLTLSGLAHTRRACSVSRLPVRPVPGWWLPEPRAACGRMRRGAG